MSEWEHWIVCEKFGSDVYTPIEPQPDGSIKVVLGLAFITTRDELKKHHPLKTVCRVDDEYTLANMRIVYDPEEMLSYVCVPGRADG